MLATQLLQQKQESHFNMPIHNPTVITIEIGGIEASNNARSFDQHNLCDSYVLVDDVAFRLSKVQLLQSIGQEVSAIAICLLSDGIDSILWAFCNNNTCGTCKVFFTVFMLR
jgi:hypothetical protein